MICVSNWCQSANQSVNQAIFINRDGAVSSESEVHIEAEWVFNNNNMHLLLFKVPLELQYLLPICLYRCAACSWHWKHSVVLRLKAVRRRSSVALMSQRSVQQVSVEMQLVYARHSTHKNKLVTRFTKLVISSSFKAKLRKFKLTFRTNINHHRESHRNHKIGLQVNVAFQWNQVMSSQVAFNDWTSDSSDTC